MLVQFNEVSSFRRILLPSHYVNASGQIAARRSCLVMMVVDFGRVWLRLATTYPTSRLRTSTTGVRPSTRVVLIIIIKLRVLFFVRARMVDVCTRDRGFSFFVKLLKQRFYSIPISLQ